MAAVNVDVIVNLLFGTDDLNTVIAGAIFALIGAAASIGLKVANGIKSNPNTPDKFSLVFLFKDKFLHFVLGLVFTAAFMRFSAEFTGEDLTLALSFLYGFLNYRLGNILLSRISFLLNHQE